MKRGPDFLIVGAAKCGTSTLAAELSLHPDVYMPRQEIHYFSKHLDKGRDWYLAHFQSAVKIQGEKSPTYLYYRQCHREIQRVLPGVKLIAILRNPIDRAYSNWNMRYNDGRLIKQGLAYNSRHPQETRIPCLDFDSLVDYYLSHRHNAADRCQPPLDIIHRGLYYDQIRHLMDFVKPGNLKVYITERFFEDPSKGFADICDFLDIPAFKASQLRREKQGVYKKNITLETRKKLADFYRPFNENLFRLLGMEIHEWNNEGEAL
jgi:hypothetical protein